VPYFIHIATVLCIYAILAQSLNVILGLGRALNLAHVASFALGAYSMALWASPTNSGIVIPMLISIGVCGTFSLILGWISLRLTSDYFAIGTLAFAALISALLINWRSFTNGVLGIPGIPRPTIFGYDTNNEVFFLILCAAVSLIIQILIWLVFRSGFARQLRAVGERPTSAAAMGIDRRAVLSAAFALSSCAAGIAGVLFAMLLSYIDPSSFMLAEMIVLFTMVVVGRPGSFWGCLGAVLVVVLIPEALRFLKVPYCLDPLPSCFEPIASSVLGQVRQLLNALMLFAVVWLGRRQLFPKERIC